jgi:hypothetical protein
MLQQTHRLERSENVRCPFCRIISRNLFHLAQFNVVLLPAGLQAVTSALSLPGSVLSLI